MSSEGEAFPDRFQKAHLNDLPVRENIITIGENETEIDGAPTLKQ